MDTEIIKSFLVGLGFGVDDASLAKFNKAIQSATLRVGALYTSIQVTAAGIFKTISSTSQSFEDMGYQLRILAPAMNRWMVMRQAMLNAYAKAGVNLTQVVRQAVLFNYSLAKTKFALEAVYKSVAAKFFPLLTKQMDIFRAKIFANMPKIQEHLTKFVQFVFKAFDITSQLGARLWSVLGHVWDLLKELDEATGGWSTKILAAVAAWEFLNLSFVATPLGLILTGLVAILGLFDDFKVWQEGGKSFFDWSSAIPVIQSIGDNLSNLKDIFVDTINLVRDLAKALWALFHLDGQGFKRAMMTVFDDVLHIFDHVINLIESSIGLLIKTGSWVGNTLGFGGPPTASGGVFGPPAPLLPSSSATSNSLQQQTTIHVNGAADANAVGKTVANQQDRVNFDLTRNFTPAVQ